MASKRDYYEVLGVGRNASGDEIRKAYRALARRFHPDVNKDPDADARIKEINEAYEVLKDDERRRNYDIYGHEDPTRNAGPSASNFSFDDIFDVFFGTGSRAPRSGASAVRGDDLRQDVEITLEEAASGVSKRIRYSHLETCDVCEGTGAEPGSRSQVCPSCRGTGYVRHTQNTLLGTFQTTAPCGRCGGEGRIIEQPCPQCAGAGRVRRTREMTVRIPAGVDTGSRIRLSGEGDAGMRRGPAGDLYLFIRVKPHEVFERRDNDLYCEVPVSFATAVLGGEVEVPTIGGSEKLEIPEGTQSGTSFVLRGKGMPDANGYHRGNQYVNVRVEVPRRLNAEQKQALRAFAEAMGENLPDSDRGLFSRLFKGDRQ